MKGGVLLNGLLKRIYENVLMNEAYTLKLRKEIDEDVEMRLQNYQKTMEGNAFEALKSDIFASCYVAEQVGFQMGIWFMQNLSGEYKYD